MENLGGLSAAELRAQLTKAESDLEDIEEMRLFTLGQTGVHLGAGRLKSLQGSWDRDEARLRQRIDELNALLNGLS
ncbi:MAG TPA: hypothetical protein VGA61_14060 [Anaerolineae bacterium]